MGRILQGIVVGASIASFSTGAISQSPSRVGFDEQGLHGIVGRRIDRATIADDEVAPATTFNGIVAIGVLASGSRLLADRGSRELREFTEDGRFVRRWAGRGAGPGELQSIVWMTVMRGDTVVAYDRVLRRISRFVNGKFVSQTGPADVEALGGNVEVLGVTLDGSIVMRRLAGTAEGLGSVRATEEILLIGASGDGSTSLGRFPGNEVFLRASSSGGRVLATPPFQRRLLVAVGRTRIAVGDTDSGVLRIFDVRGSEVARIDVSDEARTPTEHDITARLDALFGDRSPTVRARWDELQREMIGESRLPAFDALLFDAADRLWVSRYDRLQKDVADWIGVRGGAAAQRLVLPEPCVVLTLVATSIHCVSTDSDGRERLIMFGRLP